MAAIKRALISVSDKRNVVDFAKQLAEGGVELLSTGGTAKALREAGLKVTDVSEYTESPEIMDGRVKTLHPRVHGGLLMRDTDEDRAQLSQIGGAPIDLVCVNLYPFESTVARGAPHPEIIENIDIGGPSMLRSAAKNHARVTVVVDPEDYGRVAETLPEGPEQPLRAELAAKAFTHTAAYDGAIAGYLTSIEEDGSRNPFPRTLSLQFEKVYGLRYGENPHQKGAYYVERGAQDGTLAKAESVGAGSGRHQALQIAGNGSGFADQAATQSRHGVGQAKAEIADTAHQGVIVRKEPVERVGGGGNLPVRGTPPARLRRYAIEAQGKPAA